MLRQIITDIYGFFLKYYIDAAVISSILSLLIMTVNRTFVIIQKDKTQNHKISFKKIMLCFLFFFYVYMVIGITLLSRAEGSNDSLNFRLFSTFSNNIQNKIFILENVLLFLPLGIFLGHAAWKKPIPKVYVFLLCMGCSILIEVTQYITGRGKFEVDDIMTNTIGGILGYLIYAMIRKRRVMCS